MGWLFVLLAAICEVIGVIRLKIFSQKKTWINGLLYMGSFGLSFILLYVSFRYLQVSVAYAVWIGIGTAGAVLVNMVFFGESKSFARVLSLIAIIVGVTGLKALS